MKFFALAITAVLLIAGTAPTAPSDVQLSDLPSYTILSTHPAMSAVASKMAGDSLRVVVLWAHPDDGGGLEDSTFFRIKSSNTVRLSNGATVTPDTWRRRRWSNKTLADTFKVLMPPLGDSILWQADSISQCRKGQCSVPGSAGWKYVRSAAPTSMTFLKIVTDTF